MGIVISLEGLASAAMTDALEVAVRHSLSGDAEWLREHTLHLERALASLAACDASNGNAAAAGAGDAFSSDARLSEAAATLRLALDACRARAAQSEAAALAL